MIAFLGMYDMPHAKNATDALWENIRDALGFGPVALNRDGDPWDIWQSPDLLMAQTCGLPFRARLHDKVQLIGTPDYGLQDCPPGHYNSVFVVRADDPAQECADLTHRTMTYNEALSQSGWAAPLAYLTAKNIPFVTGPASGGHALSAKMVAQAGADFAALDALTWAMLQVENPALTARLRVLEHTNPTPGLPFITALGQDGAMIAQAVTAGIKATAPHHLDVLHLKGLVQIPPQDYLALQVPHLP